jgi:two-component system, OmpR family, phosphate regulon sensor histidine kinase PhoR
MGWFALLAAAFLVAFWWIRRQSLERDRVRVTTWLTDLQQGRAVKIRATDRMRFGPLVPKIEELAGWLSTDREDRSAETEARLKQLEEVRREFVANVSHELRTPLAIFQGYLETLIDNPEMPPDELSANLAVLKKHSKRLNLLVEDLLVLARLESRAERLRIEPVDPVALLTGIATDWKLRAAEKNIPLAVECANDAPEFEADVMRTEQVLNNLIDNAIKYTERGGTVSVRAAAAQGGIEFRVSDNGIGLTPDDLPHIFERFYRADKARSRELGGTGLGLSIVKHIVQLHGGKAGAESAYGRGTTIIVWLPLKQRPSTAQPRGAVQPAVNGH